VSVKHLPWLDSEKWYVIHVNQGEEKGWPAWRHSGLWLHGPHSEAHAEWCLFGPYRFGLGFEFGRNGGESDLGLTLHAGRIGNLYLRLRAPWTSWARVRPDRPEKYTPRHTGLTLFPDKGVWLRLGFEELADQWTKGQPWWRSWSFGKRDVMGPTEHQPDTIEVGMTQIPLPEGKYQATWEHKVTTTRYKRFPGTWRDRVAGPRMRSDFWLDIPGGIPVEGKGEDSWNCGMDGLFGCGATTLEAAIGQAVSHVLRDRKRYGGPHDLTRPMTVAEAGAK
jgi:hypothetical protein